MGTEMIDCALQVYPEEADNVMDELSLWKNSTLSTTPSNPPKIPPLMIRPTRSAAGKAGSV